MNTIETLNEQVSELGKDANESIEEVRRSAGRKLEEARDGTADALHAAASSVRATGRQGSEAIDNIAGGAADRLDATASYVGDRDLRDAFTGLRRFCRRHLSGSLLAAAAVGFVAGSALSRAVNSLQKTSR